MCGRTLRVGRTRTGMVVQGNVQEGMQALVRADDGEDAHGGGHDLGCGRRAAGRVQDAVDDAHRVQDRVARVRGVPRPVPGPRRAVAQKGVPAHAGRPHVRQRVGDDGEERGRGLRVARPEAPLGEGAQQDRRWDELRAKRVAEVRDEQRARRRARRHQLQ